MDRTDTMRRARILRWASLSAALAACAATLAAVSLTGWSLFQPDTRYMVAIGRWIVENGELPTSDPLTLHEGLAYICQQWPLCIAAAAIFDAFGEAGIRCAAAALDIAATATLWACTLDRGRTGGVHMAASAACGAAIAVLYRLRVRRRGGGRALLEAGDLLVLGSLMLALANVRNELFLMTSMALALSDIYGEVAGPRARRPLALASLCTAALLAAIGCLAATVPAKTAIEESAARALSSLAAAGAEPGDAVICDTDVGSELELAGYRPLLDTRAELFCPELNGGTDAWGQARSVLTGDAAAIGETGADFAVFPSGAYPALEKALTGLGYAGIYDDGCFAAYADRPVP